MGKAETLRLLRQLHAEEHDTGFGGYTEYYPGTPGSSVILTAPHGGSIKPIDIPDRKKNCCNGRVSGCRVRYSKYTVSVMKDTFSLEMAITLRTQISLMMGETPHLILCNLHRRKVDVNRELDVAAQHDPRAQEAWFDYHNFIEVARRSIMHHYGFGILFDVHGQSHPEKMIELGYTLSAEELNCPLPCRAELSSIRNLVDVACYNADVMLRGTQSLGYRLAEEGYVTVPSPSHPAPGLCKYYSGGYTIQRWGSRLSGTLDAIQLELPYHIRENYKRDGVVIASVLSDFVTDFYIMCDTNKTQQQQQSTQTCITSFFWDLIERVFYL